MFLVEVHKYCSTIVGVKFVPFQLGASYSLLFVTYRPLGICGLSCISIFYVRRPFLANSTWVGSITSLLVLTKKCTSSIWFVCFYRFSNAELRKVLFDLHTVEQCVSLSLWKNIVLLKSKSVHFRKPRTVPKIFLLMRSSDSGICRQWCCVSRKSYR